MSDYQLVAWTRLRGPEEPGSRLQNGFTTLRLEDSNALVRGPSASRSGRLNPG